MKTFNDFKNESIDDKDPYWDLFKITTFSNQAIFDAVEYGYKKAEECAKIKIDELEKELQKALILIGKLHINSKSKE